MWDNKLVFSLIIVNIRFVISGDSLNYHNGLMFSTRDKDNDNTTDYKCAERYHGAWWYNRCLKSNLNGVYMSGIDHILGDGINWKTWRGFNYSLKTTDMKIRRAV